nr:MAG TPA: NADH-ubiquinone oxidoreductase [Caudoviricetes sp.]
MDAVEFFKTANRLCKNQSCGKCPVCKEGVCMAMNLVRLDGGLVESIEETVSKVEQWAKDHPVKTRKSEFLKMFPNAEMVNIERTFCVAHFESTKKCKGVNPSEEQCIACRYRFWNEEVTDND